MTSIDELMEDKLDRLERENAQLRADKQELIDALGPYARASWIHASVHANTVAVYDKYFQEMMR